MPAKDDRQGKIHIAAMEARIILGTMKPPDMRTLKEMEGERILAMIPLLNEETFELMILHKVEQYGIWIEHQDTIEKFLKMAKRSASPKTILLFFPWSGVSAIMGSLDVPALSNEALR